MTLYRLDEHSGQCSFRLLALSPAPLLSGRPFDPRVHIVTSTARVIGALVFGHHFLLEDPFFQELIQAIDFGLAFVSTIWRRVSWPLGRQVCRPLDSWGPRAGRGLSQGIAGRVSGRQEEGHGA